MAYNIPLRTIFRQTTRMSCWFYAAKTITYYQSGQIINEAQYLYEAVAHPSEFSTSFSRWVRSGLPADQFRLFMRFFGFLEPRSRPANWDERTMEEALRAYGPLFFGGVRGSSAHVVIIYGITAENNVLYGDPADGQFNIIPLNQFNQWKRQAVGFPNPLYFPPSGLSTLSRYSSNLQAQKLQVIANNKPQVAQQNPLIPSESRGISDRGSESRST